MSEHKPLKLKSLIKAINITILLIITFTINAQHVKASSLKEINIPLQESTYVESGYPNTSPWNNRNVYVGFDTWYNKDTTRFYFKPNYAKLKELNLQSADIEEAKLVLYQYQEESSNNSIKLNLYKVNKDWSQFSINWNNQPDNSNYYYYYVIPNQAGFKEFKFTTAFRERYEQYLVNSTNTGFMLKMSPESTKATIFWSTGCLYAPSEPRCQEGQEPYIKVKYKDNSYPDKPQMIKPSNDIILNSQDVDFECSRVTDSDGDSIVYRVEISKYENFNDIYKYSQWKNDIIANLHLADNEYYARCVAKDSHDNKSYSDAIHFSIDTTPPNAPIILDEPPFSKGTTNTINWYNDSIEDGILYQLEWSTNSNFDKSNSTDWINATSYDVKNLKETRYYYRVRAKDQLGNISNWSKITYSTQDNSQPKIRYLSVSDNYTTGNEDDKINIKVGFDDPALKRIYLKIYNANAKEVFLKEETDKDYIRTNWPDKSDIIEGHYFLYAIASDNLGHNKISQPIELIVDKTSPKIKVYQTKKIYNNRNVSIKVLTKDNNLDKIKFYLNNRLLRVSQNSNTNLKLILTDKSYTLKIKAQDKAGNLQEKTVHFKVDTKPPKAPNIFLIHTKDSMKIKSSCESNSYVTFLVNGIKIGGLKCTGRYVELKWKKGIIPGVTYSFGAFVTDEAGNKSEIRTKTFKYLLPPLNYKLDMVKKNTPDVYCEYDLWLEDSNSKRLILKGCKTPTISKANISNIVGTVKKSHVEYSFYSKVPKQIHYTVDVYKCKDRVWWNPITWFRCVPDKINTFDAQSKLTTKFAYKDNKKHLENIGKLSKKGILNVLRFTKPQSNINVKSYLMAQRPIRYYDFNLEDLIFTGELKLKLPHVNMPTRAKRYFSWIFKGYVQVSQWHGNTAYQHPHRGIDFSVYKKRIYAPANGIIVAAKYHKKTKCFGGGYYIAIKHPNGMYTYYFHLDSLKDPNRPGKKFYVGQKIKRGQALALSGHSGKYKCANLPYHLHFEIRTSRRVGTDVNPVPLIDVDWNKIKTANKDKYPGRLKGDNPHPSF